MDLSIGDIINGGAGLAALYLASQIKSTLAEVLKVLKDHDTRLKKLESARARKRR